MIGQTISHYRVVVQIGAGGMGVVYRARDEQLERDVAVKVLPPGTLIDEAARKRFRKEALALARLNHPNIATIHEFGSQNGTDFLVTEYIAGSALDAKLACGAFAEKEVVSLGVQLAQGLSAAHEQDIVHRDLKPANLRLTPDGRLKILDFGLAQLMPHASEIGMTATLTQSQEITGTLPYMAPEQLRGESADARTDIWAAGAVLYEMATARRPFEEKVPTALAGDIIHKAPPPPRSLRPELSAKLEAVILKCLEKEPPKRYQSARELESDLQRVSTGLAPLVARSRLRPIVAATAVVSALLGASGILYLHHNPTLTEKDTIVLAGFENLTANPTFDNSLYEALFVKLNESPFLSLVPESKVRAEMAKSGKSDDAFILLINPRQACLDLGAKAFVQGAIASSSSKYELRLDAARCSDAKNMAHAAIGVNTADEVITALGRAADNLRRKLGESPESVRHFSTPIEQATTDSLAALKAFSLGESGRARGQDLDTIPNYKLATDLDPRFALAYARIGTVYSNAQEFTLGAQFLQKAFDMRDRATERERLYLTAKYYALVLGDLEKTMSVYQLWRQVYPNDLIPANNTADYLIGIGKPEAAISLAQDAMRINAHNAVPYIVLAQAYQRSGRFAEAKDVYQQAVSRNLDSMNLHVTRMHIAFAESDQAAMQNELHWASGNPREAEMLNAAAWCAFARGNVREAHGISQQAQSTAVKNNLPELAALIALDAAQFDADLGNITQVRVAVAKALGLTPKSANVQAYGALALAGIGDLQRAHQLAQQADKSAPSDTLIQKIVLPTARALEDLHRRSPDDAIKELEPVIAYDLSRSLEMSPIFYRAEAYLAANRLNDAAAEFQKLIDHRVVRPDSPYLVMAQLGLARTFRSAGDIDRSRKQFQAFLSSWTGADPDIPILKQAKAEYARLQ